MKRISFLAASLLAAALGVQAQGPAGMQPPPPHGGMGRFGPFEMGMYRGKVVTGAPYSADISNSMVQTLSDGNTISRTTTGHVARDSQGRTYFQETLEGGPLAANGPTTITFISDPVAGFTYVLNSTNKTYMRHPFKAHNGEHPHSQPGADFKHSSREGSDRVEADLGQQTINGVNATGKSVTRTFPAGSIGNAQPIVEKSEIWTSLDLQVVVLSKRTDPRMGQSTYSLSNIQRANPSASSFQVPSDYTLQERPEFSGRPR